jgi:hypothetical protein
LFGVKRLGHDTLGGTLFDVFTVGFKHSITLISGPKWVSGTLIQRRSASALSNFLKFLGRKLTISNRSCFQSFTPA